MGELLAYNLGSVAAPVLFALGVVLGVRWLAGWFLVRRGAVMLPLRLRLRGPLRGRKRLQGDAIASMRQGAQGGLYTGRPVLPAEKPIQVRIREFLQQQIVVNGPARSPVSNGLAGDPEMGRNGGIARKSVSLGQSSQNFGRSAFF